MTDEMDRLKQALAATRPEPDPEVRRRAMDAALRAFDEENAQEIVGATQGSAAGERQSKGRASLLARLFGGLPMNILSMKFPGPSLKPMLMGGASVAVIAIAVLATRDLPRKTEIAPPTTPAELTIEVDKSALAEGDEVLQSAPATSALEREVLSKSDPAALPANAGGTVTRDALTLSDDRDAATLRGIGETNDEVLKPVTVDSLSDFAAEEEKPEFKIRVRRAGSLSNESINGTIEPAGEAATGN